MTKLVRREAPALIATAVVAVGLALAGLEGVMLALGIFVVLFAVTLLMRDFERRRGNERGAR